MHLSREARFVEVVDQPRDRGEPCRSSASTPDIQDRQFPGPPNAEAGPTRGPLTPAKTSASGNRDWLYSAENASNSSLTRRVTKQGHLLLAALMAKL